MTTSVTISERAARRIGEILKSEGDGAMLRISVEGGGCSGFQYKFDVVRAKAEDDLVIERDSAVVVVRSGLGAVSVGVEVDFVDDLLGRVVSGPQSQRHRLLRAAAPASRFERYRNGAQAAIAGLSGVTTVCPLSARSRRLSLALELELDLTASQQVVAGHPDAHSDMERQFGPSEDRTSRHLAEGVLTRHRLPAGNPNASTMHSHGSRSRHSATMWSPTARRPSTAWRLLSKLPFEETKSGHRRRRRGCACGGFWKAW